MGSLKLGSKKECCLTLGNEKAVSSKIKWIDYIFKILSSIENCI